VVFVLIGAQLTRVVAPGRGPYLATLSLAAVGFLVGEAFAFSVQAGGPTLGVLHPVADGVTIALFELVGIIIATPRRRPGA
jgi:hypothetical protein